MSSESAVRQSKPTSNKEWVVMIDGEIARSVMRVTTKVEEPKAKIINLEDIKSPDDLNTIKVRDPFAYYSIPCVRSARLLGKEVGPSNLYDILPSRRSSPSRLQASKQDNIRPPATVARNGCISFECHPALFFEDAWDEEDSGDDNESSSEAPLDLFLDT